MRLKADPDAVRLQDKTVNVAGLAWLQAILPQIDKSLSAGTKPITIDLSDLDWIPLFEWASFIAEIGKTLKLSRATELGLDLVSGHLDSLMLPDEFLQFLSQRDPRLRRGNPHFAFSEKAYKLAGFLESLGTMNVLRRSDSYTRVIYNFLGDKSAAFRKFYSGDDNKILLGLMRVEAKEDCREFLSDSRIAHWREQMGVRYPASPVFDSEEIWRVFCHELAVNMWEHAEAPGFLAMRVVQPFNDDHGLKPWCRLTYPPHVQKKLFMKLKGNYIEICAADCGNGIAATLAPAFANQFKSKGSGADFDMGVLKFAFDELGTCKKKDERWTTERHALGRILQIVSKYGGALMVRSGKGELAYVTEGGRFARIPDHGGYEPTYERALPEPIVGTHLQVILPLIPNVEAKQIERQEILSASLPRDFRIQSEHPVGHVVPLLEALGGPSVGKKDQRTFLTACRRLSRNLCTNRPPLEPVVFDFSDLDWSPPQFETFLHLCENVVSDRPVLLVEMTRSLAEEVERMEDDCLESQLAEEIAPTSESITGRSYGEHSERRYLGTYNRVNTTVLGIDQEGGRHIFGLIGVSYKQALASLIGDPKSMQQMCSEFGLDEGRLRSILNAINPLFQVKEKVWSTVWSDTSLIAQSSRVMSRHFEEVLERCMAWRGRRPASQAPSKRILWEDTGREIFNLPWQDEWVEEFLECARVLSRERYADEAAQRLIYRLERGLQILGRPLSEVNVLACATTPALLLANALHRWWPVAQRPAVADLGYYLMLNPGGRLPRVATEGGIVIIQDVLNKGNVSNPLVKMLRNQGKDVICVLAMIRLVEGLAAPRSTRVDEGWVVEQDNNQEVSIPKHAMIELKRQATCPAPAPGSERKAFWVEPRTLRAFSYKTLRKPAGKVPAGKRTNRLNPDVFEADKACCLTSGHYAFGNRHYGIALDLPAFLKGERGREIAEWVAGICMGGRSRPQSLWENEKGRRLEGDVTAVLMPLHSQISYLWPFVEGLLAQAGRRLPCWLLDATLFLGHGPAYRIPRQFEYQLMEALSDAKQGRPKPLRILVLDDATITARTIETILECIDYHFRRQLENFAGKLPDRGKTVEWIRYFAVFNRLGHAQHEHWHSMETVGSLIKIPFVFEEYARILGAPVYEETSCPTCKDLSRWERLKLVADQHGAIEAHDWAERRAKELAPTAVDSPGFQAREGHRLSLPINVLPFAEGPSGEEAVAQYSFADTAILRFHELMYMSYPPTDVLRALASIWPSDQNMADTGEYERYRWAVIEWCLRNWPRIKADTARGALVEHAWKELEANSSLVETIFEGLARHYQDEYVKRFMADAIGRLALMETGRDSKGMAIGASELGQVLALQNGINLFLLNLPHEELGTYELATSEKESGQLLLDLLETSAKAIGDSRLSFTRNLHIRFTKPHRYASPEWALRTVAENLFRGRNPDGPPAAGNHLLLPSLLKLVQNNPEILDKRNLLGQCLSLFVAAMDDLQVFMHMPASEKDQAELQDGLLARSTTIAELAKECVKWLKLPVETREAFEVPPAIWKLFDELSLEGAFSKAFNGLFHRKLEDLRNPLEERASLIAGEKLDFQFMVDSLCCEARVLTLVQRLLFFIENWAIAPALGSVTKRHARVWIRFTPGERSLTFRLLADFAGHDTANKNAMKGGNVDTDRCTLIAFGANFDEMWLPPSREEEGEGFTQAFDFRVPVGFAPRRAK